MTQEEFAKFVKQVGDAAKYSDDEMLRLLCSRTLEALVYVQEATRRLEKDELLDKHPDSPYM